MGYKYSVQLAKILREMENPTQIGPTIGEVVSAPPNLRISIWNGNVILEPSQLYMNDRLFDDHTREYEVDGEVTEQSMTVNSSDMTLEGQGPHKHSLLSWGGTGTYKAKGTIVNTDTLKKGDLVKVTPTEDIQIWFVDFKVRKLGG